MGISIGANAPSSIFVGAQPVSAVYVGATQVWPAASSTYDPDAIPGLMFRMDVLDAPPTTDGADAVLSWASTNGVVSFTPPSATRRPTYVAADDAVQFDRDYLSTSGLSILQPASYFAVARRDATAQAALALFGGPPNSRHQVSYSVANGAWGMNANGPAPRPAVASAGLGPRIFATIFDGLNSIFTLDGDVANQSVGAAGSAAPGNAVFHLGWTTRPTEGQYALQGGISALYVVSGAASAQTQREVEGYLAHKYGLQGNLPASHPFKSAPP